MHTAVFFYRVDFNKEQEILTYMWKYISIGEYAHDCKYERRNYYERTSSR